MSHGCARLGAPGQFPANATGVGHEDRFVSGIAQLETDAWLISAVLLARGFARARCGQCGHDCLVASSCHGRGVCAPCAARRWRCGASSSCCLTSSGACSGSMAKRARPVSDVALHDSQVFEDLLARRIRAPMSGSAERTGRSSGRRHCEVMAERAEIGGWRAARSTCRRSSDIPRAWKAAAGRCVASSERHGPSYESPSHRASSQWAHFPRRPSGIIHP